MAAPHHIDDPWTRVRTRHGFSADELISVLQKSIRRGLVENAALVAYEMYCTSPELEDHMWRRLAVISVEDVGLAVPDAPVRIDALDRLRSRFDRPAGDRFLFALHAVRLLAESVKDRTTDEMANWVRHVVETGDRAPEVPDWALDMHTRRGQERGRDVLHFLIEGAAVENELPDRDLTYRSRLLEIHAEGSEPA
jgi:replication-associated recombination protein RarA